MNLKAALSLFVIYFVFAATCLFPSELTAAQSLTEESVKPKSNQPPPHVLLKKSAKKKAPSETKSQRRLPVYPGDARDHRANAERIGTDEPCKNCKPPSDPCILDPKKCHS
jgi:hypothetical protein